MAKGMDVVGLAIVQKSVNSFMTQKNKYNIRYMIRHSTIFLLILFMSMFNVTALAQKCIRCNGHGQIKSSVSSAGYGIGAKIGDCSMCGYAIFKNESHNHKTCPSCGGTGVRNSSPRPVSPGGQSESSSYVETSPEARLQARIIMYGPKLTSEEFSALYTFIESKTADAQKFKKWYDILIFALCMNNENVACVRYRGATSQTVVFENQQRERTVRELNSMVNTFSIPDNIRTIQVKLCTALDNSYNSWIGALSSSASINDARRRMEDEQLMRYSFGF